MGFRIDTLAVDIFESLFSVTFLAKDKLSAIQGISTKLDSLKFLLRLAWEIKALDNNRYSSLSVQLGTIGKQLGGWIKQLKNKPLGNTEG